MNNFSLVLDNVIEGDAVDFEKVNSLKGTYIANRYSPPNASTYKYHRRETDDPTHSINTWDLTDMIAEEARKNNHLGMGVARSSMNDRQMDTEMQMHHHQSAVPLQDI